MGIKFASHVFTSYPNAASKFALADLNWLNFLVTYLFSVAMFWSLLQVLIPSSSLTVRFLESVELLISRLGSVARVIIFLQMLEFGKKPKGRWEKEGNGIKTSCRHYQFHPFTWSHLLLPPRGSQYHLLHSTLLDPPHPPCPHPQFYTFCLSLYPRRQPGQAVFTAEVIGVVWREPDPGPAKA